MDLRTIKTALEWAILMPFIGRRASFDIVYANC